MKPNIGNVDRVVRVALAVVLAILFFMDIISGVWGLLTIFLAGVLLATSFISFCPLYLPFGIRTNGKKR